MRNTLGNSPKINSRGSMLFFEHLKELRRRLIGSLITILIATIVTFIFYDFIISILFRPFESLKITGMSDVLFVNTIFEGFLIKIKVAFLSGILFSSPVHIYNLIKFIFPGLTLKEKKVVVISLFASFLLIGFSAYYGYFRVIPISIAFLTNSGFIPQNVGMLLNFGKNIFYIFRFLLMTLVLFQIPVILEVLIAMNILRRQALLKASRFVIVGIFLLSALLTPPDFISQVSLALPMIVLFFLTILIAKIFRFGEG